MAYCILKSYKLKVSPFEVFRALRNQKNCFFLDSSLNSDYSLGRFSFLGTDPFHIVEARQPDSFKKLRGLMERFKITPAKSCLPFWGGAVGFFAYDSGL